MSSGLKIMYLANDGLVEALIAPIHTDSETYG